MSAIEKKLKISQNLSLFCKILQISFITKSLDQALYAKTVEIMWEHDAEFKSKIVLQLETSFHITLLLYNGLLSIIGKLFPDACLRNTIMMEITNPGQSILINSGKIVLYALVWVSEMDYEHKEHVVYVEKVHNI